MERKFAMGGNRTAALARAAALSAIGVLAMNGEGSPVSATPEGQPAAVCMSPAAISEQFPGDHQHPLSTGVAANVSKIPLETGKIPRYQTENGTWHEGRMIPPFSDYVFDGRKPVPSTEADRIAAYNSIVHGIGEGAVRFAIVAVGTTDQRDSDGLALCDQVPDVRFSQPKPFAELEQLSIEPNYSTKLN